MQAALKVVGEQQQPSIIKIKKLPMVLGRGREADLTVAHPLVSRLHCELYDVDGTLCVRDMGSLNGTFVGEVRITEAALESGDILTVGSATFEVIIKEGQDELMPPGTEESGVDFEELDEEEEVDESEAIAEAALTEEEAEVDVDEVAVSSKKRTPAKPKKKKRRETEPAAEEGEELVEFEEVDEVDEIEELDEVVESPKPKKPAAKSTAQPKGAQPAPKPKTKPSKPAPKAASKKKPLPAKKKPQKSADGFSDLYATEEEPSESVSSSDTGLGDFLKSLGD